MKFFTCVNLAVVGALFSAAPLFAAETVMPGEIVIGMVNDLTGPAKPAGIGLSVGVRAYFKEINDRGGIHGRKIRLVNEDDKYSPDKTIDGLLKLIENEKVFAVTCAVGTAPGLSMIPVLKEYKVPLVGIYSGAVNLRQPVVRELINIRAGYQEEMDKQVDYLVKHKAAKRFALFYQNDAFGLALFESAEKALKRHGLTLVAKGSYERGTNAVTAALTSIIAGNPDVVILAGVTGPSSAFITAARKEGLKAQFSSGSYASGQNLLAFTKDLAEGLITSQVMPHLSDLSLPITKECKEVVDKLPGDTGFDTASLEGCIVAKTMVLALEKAGNPPSRDEFINAYENMKNVDIGGISLTLSPENHQALSYVYLSIVRGGKNIPLTSAQ